jgi:hypothetical protein
VETNTNALFEARHEHYSRFYAESLDICGGEMVGACAEEHGHGVEEDAEEEEKEGLGG